MADQGHWKTRLHNRVTSYQWPAPVFEYVPPSGSNNNMWLCIVRINGSEMGRADATTRVAATDMAAQRAYNYLNQQGYPQNY